MAPSTPKISYIELPATDLAATKAFYTEAFAWTWADFGPTYAAFDGAGIEGGISTEGTVAEAPDPGSESGIGPLVLFSTGDLDTTLATVTSAGGEITSPPYDYPGGRRFHFRDPSGNILGVYQSADI